MRFNGSLIDGTYLHWWFAIMTWASSMKSKRESSVIDWRSTSGRSRSSWSAGVRWAAVATSLSIQLATKRNWCSPPMSLTEGNWSTSFNWSISIFNVRSLGMSVGSRGRQAVISVEHLVEWAIPQIPPTLSTERLQRNVEELIRNFLNDACTALIKLPWNEKLDAHFHKPLPFQVVRQQINAFGSSHRYSTFPV